MKQLKFTTKCPCNEELSGWIAQPAPFSPTRAKASCGACGSKFIMIATRDTSKKDGRYFRTEFRALEISDRLKDAIAKGLKRSGESEDLAHETSLDEQS